jgi:hypothetical protein
VEINFQGAKTIGPVFNYEMNAALWRRRFIQTLRIYPVVMLVLLATGYGLGAFRADADSLIPRSVIMAVSYFIIGVVPILAIIGFIVIARANDAEYKKAKEQQGKFIYDDAFTIPSEEMHGYKLAMLTRRPPMLTGLTGDPYTADSSAVCTDNPEHIPPVVNCECGFYAYRLRADAQFELSINPGAFMLDVDLYGIVFIYGRGFRAETQVAHHLTVPGRCMRCKILTPRVFVPVFHLGPTNYTWWQWETRCSFCSSTFKEADKLTFPQMAEELKITVGPRRP